MKHKTLALISLPLVTGVVLAGCSSSDDSPATNPHPASTTLKEAEEPTATETTDPNGEVMLGAASTKPSSFMSPNPGKLVITDVRVGEHNGFDRAVFEFTGTGTPGFHAGYTDQPLQQASGLPIEVAGNTAFEIMIHGTPMHLGDWDSPLIQTGPMDLQAGHIKGITHGGVFEADTQYFVGLDKQRPYSVTLLENPTRVVVDFAT
ncbi:AMIN-like domain-containing (lipo)protein [Corynebacterium cystitidis]|uniref:AMIN-like domain-containing (lipo)protein n=1 Tax=Corynebacterium cystitidis TaxID=35757 RepID=UPI00211E01CE|nr:hypothetical protein [Corynebacterium cystitidis]